MAHEDDKSHKLAALEIRDRPPRIFEKVLRLEQWTRPVTATWIVNILTSLLLVLLLTRPREKISQEIYRLPEKPGEPVIAIRDLRLPRDVQVEDVEGLEKQRTLAESQIRPVYDWDSGVPDELKRRVKKFFQGFRNLYPPVENAGSGGSPSAPITVPPAFLPDKERELIRGLNVMLSSEELSLLKQRSFAPELEEVVLDLIDSAYFTRTGSQIFIVFNKNDIPKRERSRGLEAYKINSAPEEPHIVVDLDALADLPAIHNFLERRAQEKYSRLDPLLRAVLVKIVRDLIEPNLHYNKDKTSEAVAQAVAKLGIPQLTYKKDEVIVRKGDRLEPAEVKKIDAIVAALQRSGGSHGFRNLFLFSLILFFLAVLPTFASRDIRKFRVEAKDLVFLALTLVLFLGALKSVHFLADSAQKNMSNAVEGLNYYYLIPLAGAAMLVRMVLNSEIALVFSLVLSVLGGLAADRDIFFALYTQVGSIVAAGEIRQCRQRGTILRAGLVLGLVNALLIIFLNLITSERILYQSLLLNAAFGIAGGVFISIIVTGLVPIAESLFNYATDIKLLELLNQDHPLLKDLSIKAPGTHQHSLMVANLAEAAAKAIGANPLLTRVAAMYHDIGKMNKPIYYAENQWDGVNIHDRLSPSMSTLIIHSHIKEGIELAEKYSLPRVVIAAIAQHHGTGLLRYFYDKAKELNPTNLPVEETEFRYPGPKPQTRETAIIMLADAVESAARTVRDPNPPRLQGMVQKLINRFFTDGQLEECDLTLKNLHDIARSFNTTLGAIYHHRPDYPLPVVKGTADPKKKSGQDADKSNHKAQAKDQDQDDQDQEDSENYLKRLGL